MGGACSDPAAQYRNRGILFEDVKNAVVPSLIASPGLVSGYAFGAPTNYTVEETRTTTQVAVPAGTTTTTIVSQAPADAPVYVNPAEAITVSRLNIIGNSAGAAGSRSNLVPVSQTLDAAASMFADREKTVTAKASSVVNDYVNLNSGAGISGAQIGAGEQVRTTSSSYNQTTTYVQPGASTINAQPSAYMLRQKSTGLLQPYTPALAASLIPSAAALAPVTAAPPVPAQASVAATASGMPFNPDLVASKIDIYGHRTWQDGNVVVQTPAGNQAYQQLDIYGNRRREFAFTP